jgi:hypothetical protein
MAVPSRVLAGLAIVASLVAEGALAQPPAPEGERVALVDPGAELEGAARASLEPWNVEVVVVPPPAPGATMPGTSEAARAVAVAHGAAAVVWVSEHEGGFALWVYDLATDRVTAQRLPAAPPFDAPAAAGVALSIKTLLRHSAVAPEAERFGASSEVATETAPTATTVAAARDPSERAREPDAEQREVQERGPSRFDVEARAGMRLGRTDPRTLELRLGLGLLYFPASDFAGIAFRLASGAGVGVDDPRFRGRLVDHEAFLGAILRWRIEDVVRLSATGGAGLHVTVLEGTVLSTGQPAEAIRAEPSLDAELGIDWLASDWLRVGVRGGLSWLFRTQRYLVHGNGVLEISPVAFEAAIVLGAMLPD